LILEVLLIFILVMNQILASFKVENFLPSLFLVREEI